MFREMKPQTSQDGLQRVPKSNFSLSISEVAANKNEVKLLMKAGIVGMLANVVLFQSLLQ